VRVLSSKFDGGSLSPAAAYTVCASPCWRPRQERLSRIRVGCRLDFEAGLWLRNPLACFVKAFELCLDTHPCSRKGKRREEFPGRFLDLDRRQGTHKNNREVEGGREKREGTAGEVVRKCFFTATTPPRWGRHQ